MKAIDYWLLCDVLTVRQTALLMMREDPGDYPAHKRVGNPYEAIVHAIHRAIGVGIEGEVVHPNEFGPDENLSEVKVESLKPWLRSKGITTGFFFPETTDAPDYLDSNNQNYSPKLAAAVNAWIAVSTESIYQDNGQSVKTNIANWVIAHAADYGLLKEDGSINNSAINDQISTVANFNPKGGAPSTPQANPSPQKSEPTPLLDNDLENIPF